jgi:excisionase family DNA binding protein
MRKARTLTDVIPEPAPAVGEDAIPVFLKVKEVAEQLRVSNMTVYRLIKEGHVDAIRIGRSFRVYEESFKTYKKRQAT